MNTILTDNHRKAALSFAYLSAVCAKAGYTCEKGPSDDLDSVDANVRGGGSMRPQIDVQLKATSAPDWRSDGLRFNLKRKNYNDLRAPRLAPIILVVLVLPKSETDWLECTTEQLILRQCAWWLSLVALPEIESQNKVVILPRAQCLTPTHIKELMKQAAKGKL